MSVQPCHRIHTSQKTVRKPVRDTLDTKHKPGHGIVLAGVPIEEGTKTVSHCSVYIREA